MINNIVFGVIILVTCMTGFAYAETAAPLDADSDRAKLPIEIEADKLLVLQKDTMAVFAGNVEAIQGDVNLRSDEMTVHYRDKSERTSDNNSVSRIDVKGNVFLSTPKETASGNQGAYDVDKGVISLRGAVTLTQGDTIIKGEDLVYNLVTGKSEIKRKRGNGRVRLVTNPSTVETDK